MPLVLLENNKDKFSFAVWQVNEDLSFFLNRYSLCKSEKEEIKDFGAKRKLEWVASRYLFYLLKSKRKKRSCCMKDKYGKPYLKDSKFHISLSHSGEYVTAIISKYNVGIDIQEISEKVERIKAKFLSKQELKQCDNDILKFNRYWTAKEALYKGYGKKGLAFIENIIVKPFRKKKDYFKAKGIVKIHGKNIKYSLFSKKIGHSILTIAVQKH